MLRLLQKKLTVAQAEFTKHLLFVLSAHCALVVLLVYAAHTAQRVVLNMRTSKKPDNVIISWRTPSKKISVAKPLPAATQIPVKPAPVQKIRPKPLEPINKFSKIMGQSSAIDLGSKKKRKTISSYEVPTPPEPEKLLVNPTPKIFQAPVVEPVPEEPLVISVQEFQEQQQIFEIVDAVRRWWQPPSGVNPEALCIVVVHVSAVGACQEVFVQQSSGIPAYDIAAKSAVIKSNFPKLLWGKQCVFQF